MVVSIWLSGKTETVGLNVRYIIGDFDSKLECLRCNVRPVAVKSKSMPDSADYD